MRTSWLLVSITVFLSKIKATQSIPANTTCDVTKEFDCGSGILGCLPKAWQCDNVKDCHNGADEINCEPNDCKEGELLCQDRRCVKGRFKCDGLPDCYDDTDEEFCEYNSRRHNVLAPFNFGDPRFYIKNGGYDSNGCRPGFGYCAKQKLCIPNLLFCDGFRDCYDGYEDERNCTKSHDAEESSGPCKNKFVCKTNQTYKDEVCIQMEEVCNGKKECPLGDDESEKCWECSTKHCGHQCKKTPTGAKCACNKGYRLDSDGVTCIDIDECTQPKRACDHFCENQMGSFRCSCANGYQLKADGKTCEPTTKTEGTLYIGHWDEIRQIPLEDFTAMDSTSTYKTEGYLEAFTYFRRDNTFFMSLCDSFIAKKCQLEVRENGISRIILENISGLKHLAVDWIGVLRDFFAIYPMRGLLFFSDRHNRTSRIMMTNMDGSQMQSLFERDFTFITTLTIDVVKNDLYFNDVYTQNLHRLNIDTMKNEVIASNFPTLMTESIAYHNGFLYFSELMGEVRVFDVTRSGVSAHQILHHHFRSMRNLKMPLTNIVVNATSQQLEPSHNSCKELDCPWICVIVPDFTAKCLCPNGYTSSILGTTCVPSLTGAGEHDNLTHIALESMKKYCEAGVGCMNGGSCREVLNKKNKKDEIADTVSIVSKSTIGTVVYYENDAVSLG
ncbi:unnamed protein product [Caenorhabditis brenneri]